MDENVSLHCFYSRFEVPFVNMDAIRDYTASEKISRNGCDTICLNEIILKIKHLLIPMSLSKMFVTKINECHLGILWYHK